MTTAITTAIAAVLGSVGAYFTWKSRKTALRREASDDLAEENAAFEAKKNEIRQAVYSNDDAKLNQLVNKLLALALLLLFVGCTGPKTVTVYIPTDRRIETCTNSIGVVCKAVPNAVMEEMLVKLQELKDLKAEQKVDQRVSK